MEIVAFIFLIAAFLQFLFYGVPLVRFVRYKPYENPLAISDIPVSVIVCARDELENLKNLIPKLLKQAYTGFEIIIVDDRSEDGTYEFLLEEKKKSGKLKVVRVDFVPDHVQPKKFAITLGIKAAENDLVILTDADCEPASIHWLKSMAGQFSEETKFVLGFSYYHRDKGLLNRFVRYETLQTGIRYLSAALGGNPYMGVGRNLGYRKSFFLSVKGFHNDLKVVGGDDDLLINRYANRKNTRAVVSPDNLVYTWAKKKWKEYFVQKKRHLAAGKRYKVKDLIALLCLKNSILAPFGCTTDQHVPMAGYCRHHGTDPGYDDNVFLPDR
jgi:cellulose synthase/poly-beta-1,6-N-acetylglucosamine synthase-like glycosyltransferase